MVTDPALNLGDDVPGGVPGGAPPTGKPPKVKITQADKRAKFESAILARVEAENAAKLVAEPSIPGVFQKKKTRSTLVSTGTRWFPILFQAVGICPSGLPGSLAEICWDRYFYSRISEAPNYILNNTKDRNLSKLQLITYEEIVAQMVSLGFVLNLYRSLGSFVEIGGYREFPNLSNPINLVVNQNFRVNSRAVTVALEGFELQLKQFYLNPEIISLIAARLSHKYIGDGVRKQLLLPSIELPDFRQNRNESPMENADMAKEIRFIIFPTDASLFSGDQRASGCLLNLITSSTNYLNKLSETQDVEDLHTVFRNCIPDYSLNKTSTIFSVDPISAQGVKADTSSLRNIVSLNSVAEADCVYGRTINKIASGKYYIVPTCNMYKRVSVNNGMSGPSYVPVAEVRIDDRSIGNRFFEPDRVYSTTEAITIKTCALNEKDLLMSNIAFSITDESERQYGLFESGGRRQVTEPGIFFHAPISNGECSVIGTTTNSFSEETCEVFSLIGSKDLYHSVNMIAGAKSTKIIENEPNKASISKLKNRVEIKEFLKNIVTTKMFMSRTDTDYYDVNFNQLMNENVYPLLVAMYSNSSLEKVFQNFTVNSTRVKMEVLESLKAWDDVLKEKNDNTQA